MASEEKKVYPGNLDRYNQLRELRLAAESSDTEDGPTMTEQLVALSIAEELAGLAYILDGIRYAARKK